MIEKNLPPTVVLGISLTGLSIMRSLGSGGVKKLGVTRKNIKF